jgi:hypothetical protein
MSFQVNQALSLMIPRVFPQWIDEQVIVDIFHQQHIGRVYKVSIIRMPDSKKRSYPIYQAFIYFSAWYDNEIAYNFQQRIYGPKAQARIVYDDPWYWVAFENTKRRLSNNDKRIMRLGYQAYVQEQANVEQEQRIRRLEDLLQKFPDVPKASGADTSGADASGTDAESRLNWYLTEDFAMNTLGQELNLTETAINVAEAVLEDMDISGNDVSSLAPANWYSAPWLSYQQTQLEAAAAEVLGAELDLTETAISVAEAALEPMDMSDDDYVYSSDDSYNKEDYDENWVSICKLYIE